MIEFRQKTFSEYDAMRSLYKELLGSNSFNRNRIKVIDQSGLIPVLRGNNIVIERFVINTSFARKDRYRMYLKIGARAKMPERVRLQGITREKRLGTLRLSFGGKLGGDNGGGQQGQNQGGNPQQSTFSETTTPMFRQKNFSKNKGGNGGNGGNGVGVSWQPEINLSYQVQELLGDAIKYDPKERSLVLEFDSIRDAINALEILPFGLNYNLYLLNL